MLTRALLHVSLATAAFFSVAALIRGFVPWPSSYGLRAKVEHYREHKRDYDTLFVGTSLTFRAVDPTEVDRAFSRHGVNARTFNFGVPGLTAYELDHLVRWIAEQEPDLERLFVEHVRWSPRTEDAFEELTDRSAYWHDLRSTFAVVRSALASRRPTRERVSLAWLHVKLMCRRYSNYATFRAILGRIRDDDTYEYLSRHELLDQRGYQDPMTLTTADALTRRRMFLSRPEQHARSVRQAIEMHRKWRRRPEPDRILEDFDVAGVRDQVAALRPVARELCYFLPPALGQVVHAFALEKLGVYPMLVALSDPEEHPPLFDAQAFFDRAHLNRDGARLFSRRFVQVYLETRARRVAGD